MKNYKVKIGFSGLSDIDIQETALHILQQMNGNSYFPTPSPSLTAVEAKSDDYTEKLAKALKGKGGVDATAQKNKSREELIFILQDLARYVETTAKNDYTVLLSSGFEIHKDRTPGTLPAMPATGNTLMFVLRYASTSHPEWMTTEPFTKRTFTIVEQRRGDDLKIEIKAMNGHGSSDWSQASTWFIR